MQDGIHCWIFPGTGFVASKRLLSFMFWSWPNPDSLVLQEAGGGWGSGGGVWSGMGGWCGGGGWDFGSRCHSRQIFSSLMLQLHDLSFCSTVSGKGFTLLETD